MRLCNNKYTIGKKITGLGSRRIATYNTMSCLQLYRMSHEECARLREIVPYVKVY